MGRQLTPEELAEYNAKRRRSLEETAAKLGISLEELERREQEARAVVSAPVATPEKEQAAAAMRAALNAVGKGFIESLKTDTQREALDIVEDIDGMSEEAFTALLTERMSVLDEEERNEVARVITRRIYGWRGREAEPLSLREVILLDLQSMIKRHNYYADKGGKA